MEREPYPTPPGSMFNGLGVPAFESVTRQSTFPPGIGLPGSVWAIGSPVWIADVTIDANFPRAQFAAQDGLHGAFGFPIRCGNEITGVIEFFSREIQQPDEDLLKMMATIGSQIGQFTERRRAEQALGESEGLLRAVVETAADGIITIDERGIVRTMNPAAERIFGYASSEVAGHNVAMLMPRAHQAEHDSHIANYLRTGKSNIMGIGREVSGLRKDGAIFPLDIKVSETWLDKRRIFTGIVRDITERKEAEIKLQAQLSRLDLLHQITRAIGERQDLPSMFQVIVRSLEENLPIDFGCVCLYDPAEETLTADISAFATSSVPRSPTKSLLWDAPYRLPKVATSFLLSGIGPSFAPLRKVSPDARF